MNRAFTIFGLVTLALLSYALYQGMYVAPREATMGEIQRIFYYHVPSAWVAGVCFFVNFLASIVYLWRRNLNADALAAAHAAGIELSLDGDDLLLEASAPPDTAILDLLSNHKAGVVALLRPDRDGWSAEDWQVYFDANMAIR